MVSEHNVRYFLLSATNVKRIFEHKKHVFHTLSNN